MSLSVQELRLFLEELCCELCRFRHMVEEGQPPDALRIEREFPLATGGPYADIHVSSVRAGDVLPYFIEVKFGVPDDELLSRIQLKYGHQHPALAQKCRLILVVDLAPRADRSQLCATLRRVVDPRIELEIWDEGRLLVEVGRIFGVKATVIDEDSLLAMRQAVQSTMARYAFGEDEGAAVTPLASQLLWRFAFYRLRQIRSQDGRSPRDILPPGVYRGVAVVIADLCSFSSFVRDTPDDQIVRDSLTSFYSKARYEVVNRGGMIENFVGDQVLALFGVPDRCPGYIDQAMGAAQALLSVGAAVSDYWQRQIDRQQPSSGMHIGVAYGDLQIVALRPSSRTHSTAIADSINVAARLMNMAAPGEILVANSFYQQLSSPARSAFLPVAPQDARNVGRLRAWRLPSPSEPATANPGGRTGPGQ